MTLQNEICEYLKRNKSKDQLTWPLGYALGNEAKVDEGSDRYFRIYYHETRTDQVFLQITPMMCSRSGYLKIDGEGKISLTDDHFKPYQSSMVFSYDGDRLRAQTDDSIADKEMLISRCVKGLFTVGMFAVIAGAAYCAIADELKLTR